MNHENPETRCPECTFDFPASHNKATRWQGVAAGATAAGAAGAGAGVAFGSGTGIVTGGLGFAGLPVFITIGAIGGAAVGGISGGWFRDRRLKCPNCKTVFKNPAS